MAAYFVWLLIYKIVYTLNFHMSNLSINNCITALYAYMEVFIVEYCIGPNFRGTIIFS